MCSRRTTRKCSASSLSKRHRLSLRVDKLYLRIELPGGLQRHLLSGAQPEGPGSQEWGDVARTELERFQLGQDPYAADWLVTAEGTYVPRAHIVEVVPVRIDVDNPPWAKWVNAEPR